MDGFTAAARLLPPKLRRRADAVSDAQKRTCEEIRLRRGQIPVIRCGDREITFSDAAAAEEDLRAVLEAATGSSLHAAVDELRRGFLSAPGGVRVGVCGTAVTERAEIAGFRAFTSLNLRVPRELHGCADGIWDAITAGGFRSLLLLSPPGAGKSTLLRELVRRLSDAGERVSVADERGEIGGGGAFSLGSHTDVMTGAPKAKAAGMLLRAMNPTVLAMDEITDGEDARALLDAVGVGAALLATVHARDTTDVLRRPVCRMLLEAGAFERCVVIRNDDGRRRYSVSDLP